MVQSYAWKIFHEGKHMENWEKPFKIKYNIKNGAFKLE